MRFDDIIRRIGEFGPYQKRVYFLLCLPAIVHGIRMVLTPFIQYIPKHRCAIPGFSNDTYQVQSESHEALINQTIPYVSKDGQLTYDQCHVYNNDYVNGTDASPSENRTIVKCDSWVYDKSMFEATAVSKFNMVCDDALETSHAQMVFMGGFLVGVFVLGEFADRFGRKKAFILSVALNILGGVSLVFAPEFISYALIRFVNGASTSGFFTTAYIVGVEFVGPSKRLWTGMIIKYFFALGGVILDGLAYVIRDWRILELVITAPLLLFLSYACLIPESPRWLLNKGRIQEAEVILRRTAKANKVDLPEDFFKSIKLEQKKKSTFADFAKLFTSKVLLIRTLIVFYNWMVTSMVYYGVGLNANNLGTGSFYINFLVSALMDFPAVTLCIFCLDRWGRKPLHCFFMLVGGVSCLLTIVTILYAGEENQWITVALAMIGKFGSAGTFATVYIHSSELFPTVVRNTAFGLSSSWARVGGMISPYIVDAGVLLGGDFGRALPLVVFGASSVLAGLISLLLPETLHADLPETVEDGEKFGRRLPKHQYPVKIREVYSVNGVPIDNEKFAKPENL